MSRLALLDPCLFQCKSLWLSFYDELDKFETLPEAFGGDGKTLPNDVHG